MTEIVTYSLRNGQKRSDQYYLDITAFVDEVLNEAETQVGKEIKAFQAHLSANQIETPRTFGEYAFELLTLGVLWRIYLPDSVGLGRSQHQFLTSLVHLRRKYRSLKPTIDAVRGVLGTVFLFSKNGFAEKSYPLTSENFEHLLDWLEATGDFKEEVKRLDQWHTYGLLAGPARTQQILSAALDFSQWFETRAEEVLGAFTRNVDVFLSDTHPGYRWREDYIFCGRQRVEYHLNMVGIEIMNQAFRQDFLDTEKKVLLVPPCMRAKQDDCEAVPTPLGELCTHCTPNCRVHQVTRLGEKHGFKVFQLPNSLSVLDDDDKQPAMEQQSGKAQAGVIGVSCPLTIVTGGWEVKAMDVPVQGLLLDYCGCPWHWHLDEGIITEINFKQLLKMMDVE